MNNATLVLLFTASLGAAAPAAATRGQHEGHQTPAQPAPPAACVQGGQQALGTVDAALQRLEAARQTNSASEMRAAVADVQAALGAIRSQLAPCRASASPAASSHEHQAPAAPGTPVSQPGPPAPAPGMVQPTPAQAVDPVCSMKVDPKTAPKADYRGKTFYFCSESDRQLFLKDPAKYVKKE
jgi:YHS domain-containing protein